MFYKKLKKTAETNYEIASAALKDALTRQTETVESFRNVQEDSLDLCDELCEILNSIANTPIEIKSDIDKALTVSDTYKSSRTSTGLSGAIHDMENIFMNGFDSIMANKNLGTNSKLIAAGSYMIGYSILATIINKKEANELHEKTKLIYRETEGVNRLTISIETRRIKIHEVFSGLKNNKAHVESFKDMNYLDIDIEQRLFLGSTVNNLLKLSSLISDRIV